MPQLDKTGPQGDGQKTGRGMGPCNGDAQKRGFGRGFGCGRGCGRGFGWKAQNTNAVEDRSIKSSSDNE